MIHKEEYGSWKQQDTTVALFKLLTKKREEFKENLILNRYENEDVVKGKAMMILELLSLDYETLNEELNE
jgi:septum formation inhibitor-activating ATPase MinD